MRKLKRNHFEVQRVAGTTGGALFEGLKSMLDGMSIAKVHEVLIHKVKSHQKLKM